MPNFRKQFLLTVDSGSLVRLVLYFFLYDRTVQLADIKSLSNVVGSSWLPSFFVVSPLREGAQLGFELERDAAQNRERRQRPAKLLG